MYSIVLFVAFLLIAGTVIVASAAITPTMRDRFGLSSSYILIKGRKGLTKFYARTDRTETVIGTVLTSLFIKSVNTAIKSAVMAIIAVLYASYIVRVSLAWSRLVISTAKKALGFVGQRMLGTRRGGIIALSILVMGIALSTGQLRMTTSLASVAVLVIATDKERKEKMRSLTDIISAIFNTSNNQAFLDELVAKGDERSTEITHMLIPITVMKRTRDGMKSVLDFKIHKPVPNTDMKAGNVAIRICLGALFGIKDAVSYTIKVSDKRLAKQLLKNKPFQQKFQSYMLKLSLDEGFQYMGGTGLNKGTFYACNWPEGDLAFAHEAIGYLSLLFTPAGSKDGRYFVYNNTRVLVVSEAKFRAVGLPGDGAALGGHNSGQFRVRINGNSVGKGVMVGYAHARNAMQLDFPLEWEAYDLVICENDVKVHPVAPGEYLGRHGKENGMIITHDNIWNVKGQAVGLGFEFWQFMQDDPIVRDLVEDEILRGKLPSYEEMIVSAESGRRMQAFRNDDPDYEVLELNSKLQEALLALGKTFPWVAKKLAGVVVNYVMHRPFNGTEYRLVITVTEEHAKKINALRKPVAGVRGDKLFCKYPIVAGVAQVVGRTNIGPFVVLEAGLAGELNTDSDGDGGLTIRGPIADKLIRTGLIDELVGLNIDKDGLERRRSSATMESMAIQAITVFSGSASIGKYTNMYYRGLIYNKVLADGTDEKPYLNLTPILQSIELTIKGAKFRTEVRLKKNEAQIYIELEKAHLTAQSLREMVEMPWARADVNALMTDFNTGGDVEDILATQIEDPLHYMDFIWNTVLIRVEEEVIALRDGVEPLAVFAGRMIHSDEEVDGVNTAELASIKNLWSELRPGGLTSDHMSAVVEMVQGAGQCIPVAARLVETKRYLDAANPLLTDGGYIVHLNYGSLVEMTGGPMTFMPDTKSRLVRVYNPNNEPILDPESITIEDGVPYLRGASLEYGTEYSAVRPSEEIIISLPALEWEPDGMAHTQSAWMLIGDGMDAKRVNKLRTAKPRESVDPYADFSVKSNQAVHGTFEDEKYFK